MGNECENWFEIKTTNKDTLRKLSEELKTIGYNGCYGYRDIETTDNKLTARGTTKWNPPIDDFKRWTETYPDIELTALYKEEFLQFAGRITSDSQEHVDFETVTPEDVRNADSGILYELNTKLYLADHMDDWERNDNV